MDEQDRLLQMAAADAEADLLSRKAADLEELDAIRAALTAARGEPDVPREERDTNAAYLDLLLRQIERRQQDLLDVWEARRSYKEAALRLREEIAQIDHRRRAFKTDIMETQWRIETKQEVVNGLQVQLAGIGDEGASEQPLQAALLER